MSEVGAEQSPGGQILVYGAADGAVRVDVRLDRETVWLRRRQMAEVFDTTPQNVLMHLQNVFADDELDEDATTKDFLRVRSEGGRQVRRHIRHYDLDATGGNKRIGSLLFRVYLEQEGVKHPLNPQALTALTLLIAESAPRSKDLMIRLVVNLLAEPAG